MDKNKTLKTVIIVVFVILAGILYSCNFSQKKPQVEILSQNENTKNLQEDKQTYVKTGETLVNNKSLNKSSPNELDKGQNASENSPSIKENSNILYVHICGAVNKPDVYKVKDGTRIVDAIQLAGGLTDNAAGDYINQASLVTDGQQLYIPTKAEVKEKSPEEYTPGSKTKTPGKVNINTANMDELMSLTGIGESKAKSIIAYRQDNGGFKSIDEIKNIDGIKDSVFNKISDLITVN